MNNITKILGSVAVAGIIAAGSSAFTAGGLVKTGTANADQFIGGTVTQLVSGAALHNVAYSYFDTTNTAVTEVELTFDSPGIAGRLVTATFYNAGANTGALDCTLPLTPDFDTVTCTVPAGTYTTGFAGLTKLDVNVVDAP